jgi:hypothetical protein
MSNRAAPGQVQTVLGPVAPGDLGFTLPHEHTKCSLWWIENRWDYWELIGDEPRINEELATYRALGGGTLVDVTPVGIVTATGVVLSVIVPLPITSDVKLPVKLRPSAANVPSTANGSVPVTVGVHCAPLRSPVHVDVIGGVQLAHLLEQGGLRRVRGHAMHGSVEARFACGGLLVLHVHVRGWIVAHEDHLEARLATVRREKGGGAHRDLGLHLLGDGLSIDQRPGHDSLTRSKRRAAPSTSATWAASLGVPRVLFDASTSPAM